MSSTWAEDAHPAAVEISAPARVHVTLIEMNGSGERLDGSVGFALDEPRLRLRLVPADLLDCTGGTAAEHAALTAEVTRAAAALGVKDTVRVHLLSGIPAHQGFGAGTQLRLAVLEGLAGLNGRVLAHPELVALSGRGGTSGIGVHAFRHGGLLVDGGHLRRHKAAFAPSRFAEATAATGASLPPVLYAGRPPEHWGVVLAVPKGLSGLEGAAEREFMAANTPVPLPEVHEVSHTVLMGLLPALVEQDLPAFGSALTALQDVGWKRRHWDRPELRPWRRLVDILTAAGAVGGGLSSTGPLVYGLYDRTRHDDRALQERIATAAGRAGLPLESVRTTRFGTPATVETLGGTGVAR
ncbi:beta-ribofuranosylaminobenzene 5'-phosphate synthase family protein [Streptomyces sp. CB03911]|uniref:beta-ribofuranosylaminobenzene 5'-phosphate synthase family protein n=1 Tax=Streptomycetaceae TaxID=2062 RepID=UPI00093B958E|nr:beta-ribofuranosylaminobenzene 5'-phosphate synthase family protein [Streptomyces sp. CB03911]OKI26153.1 hypothetical protein A6A07_29675 [Streptomyces sp. CB03911]